MTSTISWLLSSVGATESDQGGGGATDTVRAAARAILRGDMCPVANQGDRRDREARLTLAKERWLQGHPEREVVATKEITKAGEMHWVIVFIEDDRGILRVRGTTLLDALERALSLLVVATRMRDD